MPIQWPISARVRSNIKALLAFLATSAVLLILHLPLLRLPYYWDEAGYYIPTAVDFYRSGLLTPISTPPSGHTPLVMIYLGLVWHILGYSAWATRGAMSLLAVATITSVYVLGRRVATREVAGWSALLLGLSPLFFAQTTLAHLDLAAGLFTTWAVLCLLDDRLWLFALASSLAVISKETAVVLLPVAWLYAWQRRRGAKQWCPGSFSRWTPLVVPLLPLAAWTLYYHHATGYWTGNPAYLSYNVYSTLSPVRMMWSLLRRAYELLLGGFNWLLTAFALWGLWWGRRHRTRDNGRKIGDANGGTQGAKWEPLRPAEFPALNAATRVQDPASSERWWGFIFLSAGLVAVYLLLLSVVGGAILPRYLLPVVPLFYLAAVGTVTRLPRIFSRVALTTITVCFVWAWFINPPYPFPFEDNLAYADFIVLHQQAAHFLEAQPVHSRILTAWPATDEISEPFLGYVQKPLRVVPLQGFSEGDFRKLPLERFDFLYLYSRRWEPPGNWVTRFPVWLRIQGRYFDYQPQVDAQTLVVRYHLQLRAEMERRGQWVRIYSH